MDRWIIKIPPLFYPSIRLRKTGSLMAKRTHTLPGATGAGNIFREALTIELAKHVNNWSSEVITIERRSQFDYEPIELLQVCFNGDILPLDVSRERSNLRCILCVCSAKSLSTLPVKDSWVDCTINQTSVINSWCSSDWRVEWKTGRREERRVKVDRLILFNFTCNCRRSK